MLNRSSSELEELDLDSIFNRSSVKFDDLNLKLILEEIDATKDWLSPPPQPQPTKSPPPPPKSSNILLDRAFLEAQLELECAAVASRRNKHTEPLQSTTIHTEDRSQDVMGVASPGLGTAKPEKRRMYPVVVLDSDSDRGEDDQAKMETSHQSINPVQDPAIDAKRTRRRNSNAQAARRARKRKEEEETKLESEVSRLRVENSSLSKRLTDISDLHDKETRDNTALKAEVEMLRGKVNQAETTMKRIVILRRKIQPKSEMNSIGGLPSFPAIPMQLDDPNRRYCQTSSNFELPNLYCDPSIQNGTFEIPLADNCNNLQTVPNLQEIATSTISDGYWNFQSPATTVSTANTMGGT